MSLNPKFAVSVIGLGLDSAVLRAGYKPQSRSLAKRFKAYACGLASGFKPYSLGLESGLKPYFRGLASGFIPESFGLADWFRAYARRVAIDARLAFRCLAMSRLTQGCRQNSTVSTAVWQCCPARTCLLLLLHR